MATEKEILKPTAFTDHDAKWTDEANCYNVCERPDIRGGEEVYSHGVMYVDSDPSLTLNTWQTKNETYVETRLYVIWATNGTAGNDEWGIRYTDDGGSNFYDLLANGVNRTVDAATTVRTGVTLATANQDMSQVYVEVYTNRVGGSDGKTIYIWDVFSEGDYTITVDNMTLEDVLKDETPAQTSCQAGVSLTDSVWLVGTYPDAQIWKSTDSGDTWTLKKDLGNETPAQARASAFCRIDSSTVLCATQGDAQIWKSTDSGDTWTLKKDLGDEVPAQTHIVQFAVVLEDGANTEIVCLTTPKGQVWKSSDNGDTWSLQQQLDDGDLIGSKGGGIVALTEDILVASTSTYFGQTCFFWKSSDGGETWTEKKDLSTVSPAQIQAERMVKISSTTAMGGTGNDAQIWKTTDSGETWTLVETFDSTSYTSCNTMNTVNYLAVDPIDNDIIVICCEEYLMLSTDGGSNWETIYRALQEGDRGPVNYPQFGINFFEFGATAGDIAIASTFNDAMIWSNTSIGSAIPANIIAVNIGDAWKDITEIKLNIGDAWKAVTEFKINIGDVWKTITLP